MILNEKSVKFTIKLGILLDFQNVEEVYYILKMAASMCLYILCKILKFCIDITRIFRQILIKFGLIYAFSIRVIMRENLSSGGRGGSLRTKMAQTSLRGYQYAQTDRHLSCPRFGMQHTCI